MSKVILPEINIKYSKLESRLIKIARELYNSDEENNNKFHVSFICSGPRVLSFGVNQSRKSSTIGHFTKTRFNSLHSEASAYISCRYMDYDFRKLDFYNIKIGNENIIENGVKVKKIKLSAPCNACSVLLADVVGVKQVHYTNNNGEFETLKF